MTSGTTKARRRLSAPQALPIDIIVESPKWAAQRSAKTMLRQAIAAFVAEHHVEHVFKKRTRDRAHPEALARRGPRRRGDDER